MVTLPKGFTATRFPGYFWDTNSQQLFSIKIDGVLKPLKPVFPNRFNHLNAPGYRVSHKGVRKFMSLLYLKNLSIKDSEIPLKEG